MKSKTQSAIRERERGHQIDCNAHCSVMLQTQAALYKQGMVDLTGRHCHQKRNQLNLTRLGELTGCRVAPGNEAR